MRVSKDRQQVGVWDVTLGEYAYRNPLDSFKTLDAHLDYGAQPEVGAHILPSGRWAIRLDSHVVLYMDDDVLRKLQRKIGSERRRKR